jgi:GDP-mannose 6-dehydrogenase
MQKYDVCMLGMGPVGTVSGLCFAKQGFRVVGVDVNVARVDAFARGHAPFVEPEVDALLQECMARGLFHVTSDAADAISHARLIMIAVGTPTPEETGIPDLSQLDAVARSIGAAIKDVTHTPIIVVRSTVPPSTMRGRLAPLIAETSGKAAGVGFHIAANPEFLREGRAIADFFHTGRVVIGADNASVAAEIQALYKDVKGGRMCVSLEAAEFAKYVDNTWHAVKVTFANEVARVCQSFGGNPHEAAEVFLADTQLNISPYYLRPGFAFGGSCLPKDTRGLLALARANGVDIPMIAHVLVSNEEHIDRGVASILRHSPRVVGLLGCAFKEAVDDVRESPAMMVASKLMEHNVEVVAHDTAYRAGDALPLPRRTNMLMLMELEDIMAQADVLVLMHNLPIYRAAIARLNKPYVDLTTVPVAS